MFEYHRLEHGPVDLAAERGQLVAEHDDFDHEVGVAAKGEPEELQNSADAP